MPASDILKIPAFSGRISELKSQFQSLSKQYPNFQPLVALIQVEPSSVKASKSSVIIKSVLEESGIACNLITQKIVTDVQSLIIDKIKGLNSDPNVHGILIQLPEDSICNSAPIYDAILPCKDVAGIGNESLRSDNEKNLLPAAAAATLELFSAAGKTVENAKVFILGKEYIFYSISEVLFSKNAILTLSKSGPEKLPPGIESADVVISSLQISAKDEKQLKPGSLLINCSDDDSQGTLGFIDAFPSFTYFWCSVAVNIAKNTFNAVKNLFQHTWDLKPIPINFGVPGLSDIEITRLQRLKDIAILAKEIGILPHEIELYGDKKAKVSLSVLERCKFRELGKYVVIAGITPTPLGEGKSTTTVGLCQALAVQLQKNVIACLRQPSQGPTFGIKGGAAGGGYSQVIPMEEFNLHLTGDIHAVTAANNLLAAQIDARMFHEATQSDADLFKRLVKVVGGKKQFTKIQIARLQRLGINKTDPTTLTTEEISKFVRLDIDPATVSWHRVMDTNDRFLRKICVGMADTEKKMTRETQFDIAVASEIMAVLALATDMADMKKKLAQMVVANSRKQEPVTVDDLGVTGALAVLLKDAINPNLMQTIEGAPIFVHAGPFANIAHGNSSIIADKLALKLVGKNVTEAGFGSDVGLEKFCDIKCRYSGLVPNAVVIVATIRALKLHGGGPNITSGASNLELVEKGYCNLAKHIEISSTFGLPVIVALNAFSTDTEAELALVKELAEKDGAFRCVVCSHFSEGSKGAKDLAEAVVAACAQTGKFKFLYNLESPLEQKIATIAKQIYGADGIEFKGNSKEKVELFEKQGFGNLPVCMAKTPLSLSDNPAKKGVPKNFTIPIQDIKLSAGAGFVYPLLGAVSTMPGLPTRPCFYDIDIDADTGEIEGLS
ncbi:unnamed protein product [Larinioides sclopetarius]|uniref:formate--tetrahydrofolate ligase n=1 Tax=Larinioides sclopetarius TaxID=280406 RepID=A0AAV2BNL9_9ARAC